MMRLSPRLGWPLLVGMVAAILVGTLVPVPAHGVYDPRRFLWCLVCSPQAAAGFVLNAAFFVPLGVALNLVGARFRTSAVAGFLLTTAIELVQLSGVVHGRYGSVGDVVANSLGAMLGWWLARGGAGGHRRRARADAD